MTHLLGYFAQIAPHHFKVIVFLLVGVMHRKLDGHIIRVVIEEGELTTMIRLLIGVRR